MITKGNNQGDTDQGDNQGDNQGDTPFILYWGLAALIPDEMPTIDLDAFMDRYLVWAYQKSQYIGPGNAQHYLLFEYVPSLGTDHYRHNARLLEVHWRDLLRAALIRAPSDGWRGLRFETPG